MMQYHREGLCYLLLLLTISTVPAFSPLDQRSDRSTWNRKGQNVLTAKPADGDSEANITIFLDSVVGDLKLSRTEEVREAIETSDVLQHALSTTDLIEWVRRTGMKPSHNLQAMLERHPALMARAFKSDRLHSPRSMLKERAEITDDQWDKKLGKEDSLSRHRVRSLLLLFESKLQLDSSEINKILWNQPKLVRYRSQRLEEVVDYLLPLIGPSNLKRMVKRWPILLTHSVEGRIQPGVKFLQTLGDTRWERVLSKYPQTVTHSVEDVLEPKLLFLTNFLNIASAKQLVTHYPPLLWLSSELLAHKLAFLQDALDLTRDETEILIETYPQVLGLSVDNNLSPTISFLREHLSVEELREFCLYQPALLGYSLEKRLKPRIAQMNAVDIKMSYAPAYLMSLTDAKFDLW